MALKTKIIMELRLIRNTYRSSTGFTVGELRVDECGYFCDTLEPGARGLSQDMPVSKIKAAKVAGKTAIPTGRYLVKLLVSPSLKDKSYARKYGGRFPTLIEVPAFSGILIHPGNTAPGTPGSTKSDTRGCILPGVWKTTQAGRVSDSVRAYQDLMDFYLWPAHQRNEQIWLTVE